MSVNASSRARAQKRAEAGGAAEHPSGREHSPPGEYRWLPVRPKGGRVNTLTVWQRLAWIGMIPAALAVAVGMLGFALSVAGKVFRAVAAVMS